MVLQSTFSSLAAMAWRAMKVPRLLVRDPYDNARVVGDLEAPILVIHGRHDEVIPYTHGQALAQTASDGELITVECGHNDMPMGEAFWGEVLGFLREQSVF